MKKELELFIDQVDYAGNFADGSGKFQLKVLAALSNLLNAGIEHDELIAEIMGEQWKFSVLVSLQEAINDASN
jgi:hypothetical protein